MLLLLNEIIESLVNLASRLTTAGSCKYDINADKNIE
jgi:hypothetical protein